MRHTEFGNTEFGTMLGHVLDTAAPRLGLRRRNMVSALAASIGTDRSLIYRWLRHEDVPSLRSGHVARIAAFLELDRVSAARLEGAQIASLQALAEPSTRPPKERSMVTEAVRDLVESRSIDPPVRLAPLPTKPAMAHRTGVTTVRGRSAVLRAAIATLDDAPPCDPSGSATIVLSTQGTEPWWDVADDSALRQRWHAALHGVLARGWHVCQIWRLQHVERSLRLVEMTLDLVGHDGYQPRYFTHYGLLRPPHDVLVVPNHAALVLFATESQDYVDAGLWLHDRDQIRMIEAHTRQQLANSRDLLQRFRAPDQEMAFTQAMVASEIRLGGRRLVKGGLSALTFPPAWLEEGSPLANRIAEIGVVDTADIPEYLRLLRQRWQLTTQHMHSPANAHLSVCPKRAIEQLVENGCYPADEWFFGYAVPQPLIIQQLRHVVSMLRDFEHYHLALVNEETARDFSMHTTWGVTGDAVHFSMPAHQSDGTGEPARINLMLTETNITRAFRDYFDMLWHEHLAEHDKDKGETIAWLEDRLRLLEDRPGDN